MNLPRKNTGVGSHSLLQGIFQTQGLNPSLLHCRQILYHLRHQESDSEVTQSCPTLCDPMDCSPPGSSVHGILQARILEWVAISFSRGSSQPRNRTQVSSIAGRFLTNWGGGGCKNKKANRTGWTKSGMIKINGGSKWIHFAMAPQPSQALNNHMRF